MFNSIVCYVYFRLLKEFEERLMKNYILKIGEKENVFYYWVNLNGAIF